VYKKLPRLMYSRLKRLPRELLDYHVLRLAYTSDVGLAFLLSDAISRE